MKASIRISRTNIEKLLKHIVVIYSTEEKENAHILQYFDKHDIKYKRQAMETCDYTAMIPATPELGLPFDVTLEPEILIERKGSLEELAGNLSDKRTVFENECIRMKETGADCYLVIETGSFNEIDQHNYQSKFGEKAFYNTILSFEQKYNFRTHFVTKDLMAKHILRLLQLKLKHLLEE